MFIPSFTNTQLSLQINSILSLLAELKVHSSSTVYLCHCLRNFGVTSAIMADRGNNKTIYAGMKLRTVNRSEYDDNLLRNNQRYNNRLQQEIQAVEKAQRIIAKGLDKETQWFRQKMSTSSMTSSITSTSPRKRNSLPEYGAGLSYAGNGFPACDKLATYSGRDSAARVVPDYQIAGKPGSSMSEHPGVAAGNEDDREAKDRKHREGDEASSHSKRKSRTKDDERKHRHHHHRHHSSDKKSSRSSKTVSEGTAVEEDTAHAQTDDVTAKPSEGISGLNLGVEENQRKSSARSSSSSTRRSSGGPAAASVKDGSVESATNKIAEASTATQKGLASDGSSPSPSPTAAATPVSATVARDLNWDGRRRYTNVWDMLSTPKTLSTNRMVRTRLEKELSSRGNEEKKTAAKLKP